MTWHTPESLHEQALTALKTLPGPNQPLSPKDRMKIPAQEMPTQAPEARIRNFDEVAIGYSPEQAKAEALRCLQCKNKPCVEGCPVRIDIPAFIKAIAEDDLQQAIDTIKQSSLLPAICGRVCPQESQCQEPCTVGKALKDVNRGVSIGRMERFVADWERNKGIKPPAVKPDSGFKVAIVGSGPASLVAAADCRREGHAVTVFEAFHKMGGVMVYGIPEFRLPKAIVQVEIETLKAMGVQFRTNFVVGRTRTIQDLMVKDGFSAVFVGTGAGLPKFMNIEGENLIGVFSANEYLTRANLMKAYNRSIADTPILRSRKVAILGGGNVAMDAARTALRLGAEEVHIVYRRTEAEMPARQEEVAHAKEEGIRFHFLENAKRILGGDDSRVRGIECLRYQLGEPDKSGRPRPVEIPGSEFILELDTVIVAIGNDSNPLIAQTTPQVQTTKWGNIIVDDDGKTSMDGVYAGGDIVLGAATVILAMGQGRRAALSINKMLAEKAAKRPTTGTAG
jgi:glutamate synthase (NADPH/NADH) small chain